MRSCRWLLSIALIISFAAVASASQKARRRQITREARETNAILAVLNKQVAAWNSGDLPGFMSGYQNSEQLTFFSGGSKTYGWQRTLDRYRNRYQTAGNEMGHLEFTEQRVDLLGPQSAFVRGAWHLKIASGEQGGLFTLIFRRFPDGWRIIHDHTSVEAPK
jgi:beta-aspartyl-peptidase (threonine type)